MSALLWMKFSIGRAAAAAAAAANCDAINEDEDDDWVSPSPSLLRPPCNDFPPTLGRAECGKTGCAQSECSRDTCVSCTRFTSCTQDDNDFPLDPPDTSQTCDGVGQDGDDDRAPEASKDLSAGVRLEVKVLDIPKKGDKGPWGEVVPVYKAAAAAAAATDFVAIGEDEEEDEEGGGGRGGGGGGTGGGG